MLTRLALELSLHAFLRSSELRFARWDEFNLKAHIWSVPAQREAVNDMLFRLSLWILTVGFTLASLAFHITARRLLAGEIDSLKHRMIKKSKLERNVRTDVRDVRDMLPDSIAYNPLDYIDLNYRSTTDPVFLL